MHQVCLFRIVIKINLVCVCVCQVCGGLSGQREVGSHHVRPLRHGDTAGDWHQQPPAQAQAQAGHSGHHQLYRDTLRQCCGSKYMNLDPDPGFWPNLDPDPGL